MLSYRPTVDHPLGDEIDLYEARVLNVKWVVTSRNTVRVVGHVMLWLRAIEYDVESSILAEVAYVADVHLAVFRFWDPEGVSIP